MQTAANSHLFFHFCQNSPISLAWTTWWQGSGKLSSLLSAAIEPAVQAGPVPKDMALINAIFTLIVHWLIWCHQNAERAVLEPVAHVNLLSACQPMEWRMTLEKHLQSRAQKQTFCHHASSLREKCSYIMKQKRKALISHYSAPSLLPWNKRIMCILLCAVKPTCEQRWMCEAHPTSPSPPTHGKQSSEAGSLLYKVWLTL